MTVMSFRMPRTGAPQILAFLAILLADRMVSPQFLDLRLQDGRLFGSLVDVFNRGAPVALLSLGMVPVIATRGIDLSVGAVMAISGAVAASLCRWRYSPHSASDWRADSGTGFWSRCCGSSRLSPP
jgi:ribose/xylose/arabinose/galactoside ABC-type transport system permease subunit